MTQTVRLFAIAVVLMTSALPVVAQERETRLRDDFSQAGVDALELATDEPLLDAIIRFAELRKLRGRAGGGVAHAGAGPATSMARAS